MQFLILPKDYHDVASAAQTFHICTKTTIIPVSATVHDAERRKAPDAASLMADVSVPPVVVVSIDGVEDGKVDGKVDGELDGKPDGNSDGTLDGINDGSEEPLGAKIVKLDPLSEGTADGKADPLGALEGD